MIIVKQFIVGAAVCLACTWAMWTVADDAVAIPELIKQLGDDKRAVRRDAKEKLIVKGHLARKALSGVKTDDPELKVTISEILETLKYAIVSGADQEIRQLFDELERNENGEHVWHSIARKAPEGIIDVILEVSKDEKRTHSLQYGVKAFLKESRPIHAAAFLDTITKAEKKRFVGILDRANREFYFSKAEQAILFHCMKDYRRAVSRASELWEANPSQLPVDLAAASIGRSGDAIAFWGMGGRRIMSASTPARRCMETAFFCGIAQALNKPYLVNGFFELGNVSGAPAGAALLLLDVLERHGDEELIDDFLNGSRGPSLKYLLLQRFFRQAGESFPKEEWTSILKNVPTEQDVMELVRHALKFNRSHARRAMDVILNRAPYGSLYDAQSHEMLGRMDQEEGFFKSASEHFRQSVVIRSRDSVKTRRSESYALLADELKAVTSMEDAKYSQLILIGLNAELTSDVAKAEESYRAAIAHKVTLPCAHKKLINLLRKGNRFLDASMAAKRMIAQEPLTTKDHLVWCFRAGEVLEFEKALAWLSIYVKRDPAKTNSTYATALITERMGDFETSAKRFEELIALGGRYENSKRQLAMVRIKQRRLDDAEELLTTHLLRNPFDGYARLVLGVARGLNGKDDRAAVAAYVTELTRSDADWATWLLRHYAGLISEKQLLFKAESMGTKDERVGQLCEARFLIAMRALIAGDVVKARTYLTKTVDMGITLYVEHYWACDELKRLDVK